MQGWEVVQEIETGARSVLGGQGTATGGQGTTPGGQGTTGAGVGGEKEQSVSQASTEAAEVE